MYLKFSPMLTSYIDCVKKYNRRNRDVGTHIALIVVAVVVAFIGAVGISIGVGKFIKYGRG